MSTIPSAIARRTFLRRSAVASLSAGAAATAPGAACASTATRPERPSRLPREVWIATIAQDGMTGTTPAALTRETLARMEAAAAQQPDLVCLPEMFLFPGGAGSRPPVREIAEAPLGELAAPFVAFAKSHQCYVAYSGYTVEAGRYYNAVVIIDRQGRPCGEYRKTYPTVGEMEYGVSPGPLQPPVFETDFGRVGAQICFDVEWHDGWRRLRDAGAEIVCFPSAFAAGRAVNMRACQNQLVVASSTRKDTSKIVDVTGETLAATSRWNRWACAAVNLEKTFLHTWPFNARFPDIQSKYGRDVVITTYAEEEWSIIESRSPDVRVADILREFELETYADTMARAERLQIENRAPT
ncbi:MAG: carbon-nitrogen hydrolase family protein [Pirellulales bacterium]|nr:carbon-nitrogen hydrolase family protein [Pirellulales bacterium]